MKGILSKKKIAGAFTMMEMVIAIALSSIVFVFLAYCMLASARHVRAMTNEIEANKQASLAIDYIRYTLLMGEFGTTTIMNDGRRIQFQDPNLGGVTSEFKFENGKLYYKQNIENSEYEQKVNNLEDVTFESENFGAIIRVTVISEGHQGEVLTSYVETTTDILLRN